MRRVRLNCYVTFMVGHQILKKGQKCILNVQLLALKPKPYLSGARSLFSIVGQIMHHDNTWIVWLLELRFLKNQQTFLMQFRYLQGSVVST